MLGRMIAVGLLMAFAVGCQTAGQPSGSPPQTKTVATEPMSGPAEPVKKVQQASTPVDEPAIQQQAESKADPPQEPLPVEARGGAELVFLDFSGFDEDLFREMSEDEERIVVDVPAAFSLNDVPDRLDKWFARIKNTGGYVQAREAAREDAQLTRGVVGALIDLAVAAYEAQEAEELLEPARRYNVLIEYDKQSGDADQVVFYRR